jgi:hypothetical protein
VSKPILKEGVEGLVDRIEGCTSCKQFEGLIKVGDKPTWIRGIGSTRRRSETSLGPLRYRERCGNALTSIEAVGLDVQVYAKPQAEAPPSSSTRTERRLSRPAVVWSGRWNMWRALVGAGGLRRLSKGSHVDCVDASWTERETQSSRPLGLSSSSPRAHEVDKLAVQPILQ